MKGTNIKFVLKATSINSNNTSIANCNIANSNNTSINILAVTDQIVKFYARIEEVENNVSLPEISKAKMVASLKTEIKKLEDSL